MTKAKGTGANEVARKGIQHGEEPRGGQGDNNDKGFGAESRKQLACGPIDADSSDLKPPP